MKKLNLLAFDLGASNGRAILGQFDGDKLEMKELHRFENHYIEMNGVFYWDLPYLYNQLKQGLLAFKNGGYGDLEATSQLMMTMQGGVCAQVSADYLRPANAPTHGDDRVRVVGTESVLEVRDDKV